MGQTVRKTAVCQLSKKSFATVPGQENPCELLKTKKYHSRSMNSLSLEYSAAMLALLL